MQNWMGCAVVGVSGRRSAPPLEWRRGQATTAAPRGARSAEGSATRSTHHQAGEWCASAHSLLTYTRNGMRMSRGADPTSPLAARRPRSSPDARLRRISTPATHVPQTTVRIMHQRGAHRCERHRTTCTLMACGSHLPFPLPPPLPFLTRRVCGAEGRAAAATRSLRSTCAEARRGEGRTAARDTRTTWTREKSDKVVLNVKGKRLCGCIISYCMMEWFSRLCTFAMSLLSPLILVHDSTAVAVLRLVWSVFWRPHARLALHCTSETLSLASHRVVVTDCVCVRRCDVVRRLLRSASAVAAECGCHWATFWHSGRCCDTRDHTHTSTGAGHTAAIYTICTTLAADASGVCHSGRSAASGRFGSSPRLASRSGCSRMCITIIRGPPPVVGVESSRA